MPTVSKSESRLQAKSATAGHVVISFILAGLAVIAPFFISPLIEPTLNTHHPSRLALFFAYGLPWMLWQIVLPGFLLPGIVQLVCGGRELTVHSTGSQPPGAFSDLKHLTNSMYVMGVMNLVFGIPRVVFGVYRCWISMGYIKLNTRDRWEDLMVGSFIEATYPCVWIIVGLGATRRRLWSRWCGVWLIPPTILTLLAYVSIPCLHYLLSKETSGLTAVGLIAAMVLTLFFAFAYLVITLRSACIPPESHSSLAAPWNNDLAVFESPVGVALDQSCKMYCGSGDLNQSDDMWLPARHIRQKKFNWASVLLT